MSDEDMDVVRRCYESLTRGDDAWLELIAPELVVDFSRRRVDPFVTHGLDDPLLAAIRSQTLEITGGDVFDELDELAARRKRRPS